MRFNSLLAAASYLAAFAAGFEFTGPDADEKLNLSAPLINITWIRGSSDAPESAYPSFDLWFGGPNADGPGTGGSGWELRPNVSNTDGIFLWNPARTIGSGDEDGPYLTNGKDYQFAAWFTNEGKILKVESERYALEGYARLRNGASSLQLASTQICCAAFLLTTLMCLFH